MLGVSNISFGMPDREDVNAAFYHRCKDAGLSLAIINPTLANIAATEVAYDFLSGRERSEERSCRERVYLTV